MVSYREVLAERWRHLIENGQDEMSRTASLLLAVKSLNFEPVDTASWHAIRDEGLDDEQDAPKRSQWVMARLPITEDETKGLQSFADDAVEMFNLFDIHLKAAYAGRLVDLIDYGAGVVKIVMVSTSQHRVFAAPKPSR